MKNKREHRKVISFILTLVLLFTTVLPVQTAFAEELTTLSQGAVIFDDIKDHWGESAVKAAVNAGFVKGYPDGTFRPNDPVGRAEFVSMVNNALQLRQENKVQLLFTDVSENAWYHDEVAKASYVRYISGTSNTSFSPEANITRQDAATMLSRFLPKAGFTDISGLSGFPDQYLVGDWAKEGLAVVVNKGYMSGHKNGHLSPLGSLTRAEAATIINSLLLKENIIREDVSIEVAGDMQKDTIYVGDLTIEPSVGEGDAALENLSALSKVHVLGGGINTVNVKDSRIIQLIVAKQFTKVRVHVTGDSNIHYALVFNGNLLVDKDGNTATAGVSGYDSIVYIQGYTSIETVRKISEALAPLFSSTGTLTQDQVYAATESILSNFSLSSNPDGSITIVIKRNTTSRRSTPIDPIDLTAQELLADDLIKNHGYIPISTSTELDEIRGATISAIFGVGTRWEGPYTTTGLSDNYVIVKDIDLSNDTWEPLGNAANKFTGILEGNNYTLSNLTVSKSGIDYVGVFGFISGAAIENLTLTDVDITGGNCVGALAGYSVGSTITAITVDSGSVFGISNVGGLIGYNETSTISNSYNAGSVSGTNVRVGGVIGYNKTSTISNSYNTGAVSGPFYVGGVVGYNASSSTVSNSYNTGSVSGTGNGVGGVVGANLRSSTVSNSYNTGSVSGNRYIGGVVGSNDGSNGTSTVSNSYNTGAVSGTSEVGGVVGYNVSSTVTNSYNTGSVSGSTNVGGVVGWNYSSTVSNSYNVGTVSGSALVGGVVGYNNFWSTIDNSYNTGSVSGTSDFVGGVVGYNLSSTVINSYNTGAVSGSAQVGGVVGWNRDASMVSNIYNTGSVSGNSYIGGVVGVNVTSGVSNSYNTGSVSGLTYVGGVVGLNSESAVSACYWLEGTNLTAANLGIGTESLNHNGTPTFSAISEPGTTILNNMYVSMSAIATSASGIDVGAITGIDFGTESNVSFSALQGAYIVSTSGALILGISTNSSVTLSAITTTGAMSGLFDDTGTVENINDPLAAKWILITVESLDPKLNRHYVIYNAGIL